MEELINMDDNLLVKKRYFGMQNIIHVNRRAKNLKYGQMCQSRLFFPQNRLGEAKAASKIP
jgi:hypothetical protein